MRRNYLGESSTSSGEEYQSPDDNPEQSNYSLDYTHSRVGFKSYNPAARSPLTRSVTRERMSANGRELSGRENMNNRTPRTTTHTTTTQHPTTARQTMANESRSQRLSQSRRQVPQSTEPQQSRRKQTHPKSIAQKERHFLLELNKLQRQTTNFIPRLPFSRLIREILFNQSDYVNRITDTALQALQEATEMYVSQQLSDAYLMTLHRGRVTLMPKDMELLRLLRSRV